MDKVCPTLQAEVFSCMRDIPPVDCRFPFLYISHVVNLTMERKSPSSVNLAIKFPVTDYGNIESQVKQMGIKIDLLNKL